MSEEMGDIAEVRVFGADVAKQWDRCHSSDEVVWCLSSNVEAMMRVMIVLLA